MCSDLGIVSRINYYNVLGGTALWLHSFLSISSSMNYHSPSIIDSKCNEIQLKTRYTTHSPW